MKIELTEDEVKALLEILSSAITFARQGVYVNEQIDQPTEIEQENYSYYHKLFVDLSAIRDKLSDEPAPVSES